MSLSQSNHGHVLIIVDKIRPFVVYSISQSMMWHMPFDIVGFVFFTQSLVSRFFLFAFLFISIDQCSVCTAVYCFSLHLWYLQTLKFLRKCNNRWLKTTILPSYKYQVVLSCKYTFCIITSLILIVLVIVDFCCG